MLDLQLAVHGSLRFSGDGMPFITLHFLAVLVPRDVRRRDTVTPNFECAVVVVFHGLAD